MFYDAAVQRAGSHSQFCSNFGCSPPLNLYGLQSGPSQLKAIRALAGMVAKGDYSIGDFGAKALVPDAFLAACRPASNSV